MDLDMIEHRARAVLASRDPKHSPVAALLGDDAFCAQMEERILEACGGDAALAAADIEAALHDATIIDLPAGRHHLYVPNIYSRTRYESGLAALDQACGNAHEDLWFVLSEQELDLGPDPHTVTTMRRLQVEDPGMEPPSW